MLKLPLDELAGEGRLPLSPACWNWTKDRQNRTLYVMVPAVNRRPSSASAQEPVSAHIHNIHQVWHSLLTFSDMS